MTKVYKKPLRFHEKKMKLAVRNSALTRKMKGNGNEQKVTCWGCWRPFWAFSSGACLGIAAQVGRWRLLFAHRIAFPRHPLESCSSAALQKT
jgi:hypothetical protein